MNGNGHEKSPAAGPGGEVTSGGKSISPSSILIFPVVSSIPTAAGGPVHWATCDALATLARELVERGLVDDDDRLTAAMRASWAKMVQASYFPAGELEAIE